MLKTPFLFLSLILSTPGIAADLVMEIVPLNNRFASDLQPLISPFLEDDERIIANRSNLIIRATPLRQKEIKKLIDQLDTRLENLTISIIQSKTETVQSLNSSASVRLNFPASSQTNHPSRFRGHFANTEGLNHSNSQQHIQTLDGKSAYIKTGKTHPVENISIHRSGYGYPVISSNTEFIEATTGFVVTPRLSGKQVTLDVSPWSDTLNDNNLLSTQSGQTTIRVNLGQWVEIGGIDEQNQSSENGTLSHAYSTENRKMKILIKVEKTHSQSIITR